MNSKKESFFKKNRVALIIILALVLIAAVIASGAFSFIDNLGLEDVEVAGLSFKIPSEFEENTSYYSSENDSGIITVSKFWHNSDDVIGITVMYSSGTYVDADTVNNQLGGHKKQMLGQNGFLHENSGTYAFSFVKKNMLVTVYTTDISLFDYIEVV